MNNEKLIKSTQNLPMSDISLLRERFIADYSRQKGWDKERLSPDQLLEIVEQSGYKNPGLIFG
jgi:hypothetical protein